MTLARRLARRAEEGRPVRVAVIGAGKFGTMILAQLRHVAGMQLVALADLDAERARAAAVAAGWPPGALAVAEDGGSAVDVARRGRVALLPSGRLAAETEADVVVEATGHETAGAEHALLAIEARKHVVMVTVEADVVVGPQLLHLAERAGVVYSMAYGDQPALICELVDWARTCGFEVVAAGKGTKYRPLYRRSTPDTAFGHYGFTPEQIATGGFNPRMFNSFLDGTKSSIEMVAVANATGLDVPRDGLSYVPASTSDLPRLLRPRADGGMLERRGMVEVVSCVEPDGREVPDHLRWGVYVVFTSAEPYSTRCFGEYGVTTDASGRYAALWRPYHFIGLEIPVSIASAALRGEPTGAPFAGHRADVVCATRTAMRAGERIDGEGGYAVYGSVAPVADVRARRLIPMGLAHGLTLVRDVPADHAVGIDDVEPLPDSALARLRREQDRRLGGPADVESAVRAS